MRRPWLQKAQRRRAQLPLGWLIATLAVLGVMLGTAIQPAQAHAILIKSIPAESAILSEPPTEVRLWFSEPADPTFSRIELQDAQGVRVSTRPSQLDPSDPTQLALPLEALPQGTYTVVWQVLSAADGHPTRGYYAFVLGAGSLNGGNSAAPATESFPVEGTIVRWINLLSLALLVGGMSFFLWIWQPAMASYTSASGYVQAAEPRLVVLLWIGWIAVGISSLLMLWLQVALASAGTIISAITDPAVVPMITGTRYGALWIMRLSMWVLVGALLYRARGTRQAASPVVIEVVSAPLLRYRLALVAMLILLATQSLFSHAAGTPDSLIATVADWLHLLATTIWIGGLVAFALVIRPVYRAVATTTLVRDLVDAFSNLMRVSVAAIALTGIYAAWLHVGSTEALLNTDYGRSLVIKLILFVPLLAIAAVNLVFTQRGLHRENPRWVGRLRVLIGMEIALVVGVLGAVGAITSLEPARNAWILQQYQQALAIPPPNTDVAYMGNYNQMHVMLFIKPGYVGENTFQLSLATVGEDQPITDATRIRLRFVNLDQDVGESELDLPTTPSVNGIYSIRGTPLSRPGNWRIRVNIQRPDQFDTVVDFNPLIDMPPTRPLPDLTTLPAERLPILVGGGIIGMLLAGGFAAWNRFKRPLSRVGVWVVSAALFASSLTSVIVGIIALVGRT